MNRGAGEQVSRVGQLRNVTVKSVLSADGDARRAARRCDHGAADGLATADTYASQQSQIGSDDRCQRVERSVARRLDHRVHWRWILVATTIARVAATLGVWLVGGGRGRSLLAAILTEISSWTPARCTQRGDYEKPRFY